MLKKTITYKNPFDQSQVTEDIYFNLTKAELVDLESAYEDDGGLQGVMNAMGNNMSAKRIMSIWRDILQRAYGVRIGNTFSKTPESTAQFMAGEAYSELFMNLMTSDEPEWDVNAFVQAIIPQDVDLDKVAETQSTAERAAALGATTPSDFQKKPDLPTTVVENIPARATQTEKPSDDAIRKYMQEHPDAFKETGGTI